MRTLIGAVATFAALALAGCGGGDDGPGTGSQGLLELATAPAACATAADCCVAIDDCMATAYVVTRADYEDAVALAEEPRDTCAGCISPSVEVRCEAGACVGVEIVDYDAPEYAANAGSHCGEVLGQALSAGGSGDAAPAGRVFGCGAD